MKWLWYRFFYRAAMRLAHKFNWHHCKVIYPADEDGAYTLHWCEWCGLRWVEPKPMDHLLTAKKVRL